MSGPSNSRIAALDAFRGATVAAMLLVNNPGTWSAIYPPLRHAQWHGWTPTDLIFPFFLFIVGITTELAPKRPRGILRRGLLIILCGLLLNAFPWFRMHDLRWFGVLQRIGIVYLVAAFLALHLSRRALLIVTIAILVGYWAILSLGPLEPAEATIAAQVDRALVPEAHLWKQSKTWDPEGPLSTIPAVATALLGVLAAPWVREKNVKMLTISGFAALVLGFAWGLVFPINKSLWTSSYVLFTAGFAAVILALLRKFEGSAPHPAPLPASGERGLTTRKLPGPFEPFGVNPLLAFIGSGLMAKLLGIVKVGGVSLQAYTYRTFYKPYFEPKLASLLWSLTFVLLWYLILLILHKRRTYVRL